MHDGGACSVSAQRLEVGSRRTRERALRDELRGAISRREIVPYYQPIVSMRHRTLLRVEALARWCHPGRGLLEPREFIHVAERYGLMPALTNELIDRAILDLREQFAAAPSLRVSVNLSAHGLLDPDLVGGLERHLAALGASPDRLSVEITESVLVSDPDRARENIERLKRLGVRVEIDDFGTGYSSLNYLQLLPVDAVKIDRQFVSATFRDRHSEVIVRTVIGMCHELGFEAVAEGVDAPEVWGLLKALGCDAAQGYLISRPLSAADLRTWLEEQPLRGAAFEPVERMPERASGGSSSHILVVDDEPAIVQLVRDVLVEHGYDVETAANGEEALGAIARRRPALLFLDIHMPVLDGEGLMNALRERGIAVPVIVLTAGPGADHWARKLGADGSVQKPFRIPDLIDAATRFLIPADSAA